MEKIIIPAIISEIQEDFDEKLNKVRDLSSILQIDVMDGVLVKSHSLDFDFFLPALDCVVEAHLLIKNPLEWIEKNHGKAGAIVAHIESDDNPEEIIKSARAKGKKIGLALNPETPVSALVPYLDYIDQVLIMTVGPGFYGSPFMSEMLQKVREIKKIRKAIPVEVDGGINENTIKEASDAGADMFAVGSYIINSESPKKAIDSLYEKINAPR